MNPDTTYNTSLKKIESMLGNKVTDNFQLDDVGKKLFGNNWAGVHSADSIPVLTSHKNKCVFNLDKKGGRGTHWCSLYFCNGKTYFFDSFGRKLSKHRCFDNIRDRHRQLFIESQDFDAEQEIVETNCGQQSLAWLDCAGKMSIDNLMKI